MKLINNATGVHEEAKSARLSSGAACWIVDETQVIYDGYSPGPGGVVDFSNPEAYRGTIGKLHQRDWMVTCPPTPAHQDLLRRWAEPRGYSVQE